MNKFSQYLEEESINKILADRFKRLAKLEPEFYKRLAYSKAATAILNLDQPITDINDIRSIEGIGASIAGKIQEFLKSGEIAKLKHKESKAFPGVKRIDRSAALDKVQTLIKAAKKAGLTYEICGSIRRQEVSIKDVDILVLQSEMPAWFAIVDKMDTQKINRGKVSTDFILNDIAINLRSVTKESWGAGLLFLTGPQMFNISMRARAKKHNMLLSQHGLFERDTRKKIASKTEISIFKALKMEYVAPENR